jgi:hypothetical protein
MPQYDFVISVIVWPITMGGQVTEMDSFAVGVFLERRERFLL